MTTSRRNGYGESAVFLDWIRNEPRLDSIRERLSLTDCDLWVHQFRDKKDRKGWRAIDSVMLVELKQYNGRLPFAQRDTLRLINEGMRLCFYRKDGRVKTLRMTFGHEVRLVNVFGCFLLQLSGSTPEDSQEIRWHNQRITREVLIDVLTFKLHPRTLKLLDRRRHHANDTGQLDMDV